MLLKYKKKKLNNSYPSLSSMEALLLKITKKKHYYRYKPILKSIAKRYTPHILLNQSKINKLLLAKSKDVTMCLRHKKLNWKNVYKRKRRRSPPHFEYVNVGITNQNLRIVARHKAHSKTSKLVSVRGQYVAPKPHKRKHSLKKKPQIDFNIYTQTTLYLL